MGYRLTLDISEDAFSVLKQSPDEFRQELLNAALSKWYELGKISQSKAAEIAKVSRAQFLEILKKNGVSPFQLSKDELEQEINLH